MRDTAVGSLFCAVSVPKSTMPPRIRWLRNALREDDGSWPFACWQPESGRQIYQYSCPYADPHSFCSSYSLLGLQKPRFVISGFRSKISEPNPATHHTLGSHSGIGIIFSLCMSRADRSKHRRALTPRLDPDRLGLTPSRQAVAWTFDPVDNETKVLLLGSYRSWLANLSER